jgi:creatinine amidohydrolase
LPQRHKDTKEAPLVKNGAKRIVFLNTGIFKATGLPLAMAAREIRVENGIPTIVVSWDDLEDKRVEEFQEQIKGGHADEIETSIHLYLQPHLVQMDKAVTDYGKPDKKDYPGYKPGLFSRNPKDPAYSKTGLFGDPTKATAEKGKKTLEIMTANWIKILKGFSTEGEGDRQKYLITFHRRHRMLEILLLL